MNSFSLIYEGFDPAEEGLREALTSTGNGYLCTRGAAEWEDADGVHYPGTYGHGVYNRETTILGGLPVLNEDLVNLPNWLVLKLRIEGEDAIRLADVELLDYRHELDIRHATVIRELRFRDRTGRETTLRSRRFVSMADVHHGGHRVDADARELVGPGRGRVGARRAGDQRRRRALPAARGPPPRPGLTADVRARGDRAEGPDAAVEPVHQRGGAHARLRRARRAARRASAPSTRWRTTSSRSLAFDVRQGAAVRVEKMVAFFTSRDPAISDTLAKAGTSALRYSGLRGGVRAPRRRPGTSCGACATCRVPGDDRVQLLLRLHICHILQVCSHHTADLDAGVPARGLNGEAYRGHVFWDELYVYPFLNFRMPEVTRGLLMYRYRRLGEARAAAREAGLRGAMFPWQSGSEGKEETQRVHLNPLSGRWEPDLSHNQRHVNAAIFYNIWHYFQATDDLAFLRDHGAEMMLEIARFWASIAHFNPERERYEIHGVMGPDEFHERYPDADEGGLRNNAYTNVMVAWLCDIAQRGPLAPARRPGPTRCAGSWASATRSCARGRT